MILGNASIPVFTEAAGALGQLAVTDWWYIDGNFKLLVVVVIIVADSGDGCEVS